MVAAPFARRPHRLRLGRRIHDRGRERDPGLPIDAGVMHLRVQRDALAAALALALEPVDDEEFPQRPAPVEQRRMEARHVLLELLSRSRLRQRDATDVIVDVDLVVVGPHGVRQLERHQRELAREHLGHVQAVDDVLPEVVVEVARVSLRQLELVHATDVHRRLGRLEMQEARVHPAQVVHLVSHGARRSVVRARPLRSSPLRCRPAKRAVHRGNIAVGQTPTRRVCPRPIAAAPVTPRGLRAARRSVGPPATRGDRCRRRGPGRSARTVPDDASRRRRRSTARRPSARRSARGGRS